MEPSLMFDPIDGLDALGPFLSPFEEEQELIKKLQIAPTQTPFSLEREQAFAGSIAPSSAIEKTHQVRPQLPPPCVNPIPRIIQCQTDIESLSQEEADLLEKESSIYLERMKALQAELQENMEANLKTGQTANAWHSWETILNYFTAASSLLVGLGLLGTHGNAGASIALVAAGGLSLTNQIMTDLDGWQKIAEYFSDNAEKQQSISAQIQTGMFLLSLSLSVSGLALAAQSDALMSALPKDKERILRIMQIATSLLNGGTQLVKSGIEKRSCDIQAKITLIDAEIGNLRRTLSELTQNQQNYLRHNLDTIKIVKEAINHLSA